MTGYQSKKAVASAKQEEEEKFALQEQLEDQDFEYIMNADGGVEMLRSILQYGFLGYSNYTLAELRAELAERNALKA